MTIREEIAAIQARIAKAQSERDTWQSAGIQDKYLEAYSLVEALELQLERLRQEGLRAFSKHRPFMGALLTPKPLPAEFSLAFSGRQYEYGGDRYDSVADPVNDANLSPAEISKLP